MILGTRGSKLAMTQSQWVAGKLQEIHPEMSVELEIIKTAGDRLQTSLDPDSEKNKLEKGLFTREIEQALLDQKIDLAVHSLKDLPVDNPQGLTIGAIPQREASQDLIILKKGMDLEALPEGSVILTGSFRRELQWKEIYKHTKVQSIRGNVNTRLKKLDNNATAAGLILAHAGINRLGLDLKNFTVHVIPSEKMLPAPGQGALALQVREHDDKTLKIISALHDDKTAMEVKAERELLKALGGGCNEPMGALAKFDGQYITINAVYYSDKNNAMTAVRSEMRGHPDEMQKVCQRMAKELLRSE